MAKRRAPGAGRPSKGERKVMYCRVPVAIARRVEVEAERDDLAFSDVIANALAKYYGLAPVAVPKGDNQLQMTA